MYALLSNSNLQGAGLYLYKHVMMMESLMQDPETANGNEDGAK